jgi:hypothetical protein
VRKILLVVAALVAALCVPAGSAQAATPSPTVPSDCTIAPGRVQVLELNPLVSHAVMVTTLNISCTTQYGIREGITLNRYWVTSHVWTAERKRKIPADGTTVPGSIIGWNAPFYCNVAGALMSVSVTYKFFDPVTLKLVANVSYYGRTDAICPR